MLNYQRVGIVEDLDETSLAGGSLSLSFGFGPQMIPFQKAEV